MIITRRRSLLLLVLFLLTTLNADSLRGQGGGTLNGHAVRLDANSRLLAWPAVQGDAYGQVLNLATNYLLTGVPTASNGLKLYYSESYALPGNPVTPAGWPHNPAGLYSMLTDSGLAFYGYSGNAAITQLVRDVLTYQLDHGMTPTSWNWPGVAYASSDAGALTYQGAQYGNSTGVGDGVGVIQPDKVGEIGVAFLKYYEFSGAVRFRNAAVQAADVLASHVRTGSATQSPWPFRVYAQTNVIREQYSAHVISPIQLFDELIRLNIGNVSAYQTARQTAWNWLMTYPMQNNAWANYFEDVPIKSDRSNVNQLNAGETARYLMRHPEFDPNWQTHVRAILAWIEQRFAVVQFGANSIAEQDAFYFPMGSHTSRYASLNAELYELTGDQTALEKAYRSFNWATYMCATNGVVLDGPEVNHIWWTDGYGDYIRHFMAGLGSVPQWAPASQAHLLRSTSIVRNVQYAAGDITYELFDGSAREVLRLNFTPQTVTADGVLLTKRSNLDQQGWTYDSATGVMRVRHDNGKILRITAGSQTNNIPPSVTLEAPASGNYITSALTLFASASDPDGAIEQVRFEQNGVPLSTVSTPPYQAAWTSIAPGTYQLTAIAVDDLGAETTSGAVSVTVLAPALPPPPTGLAATVTGGAVNLTWSPPSGGFAVASYLVHRSTTAGFIPSTNNRVGQTTVRTFADTGLGTGTYYYRVVAVDSGGNATQASNEASATIVGSLAVDKVVFSDGTGTRTSPAFTTSTANQLLLAFASSDGPTSGGQTLTIFGAGLNWTLVRRGNVQPGSSEIWKAVATGALTNASVTSTPSSPGYDQSLTVITFSGAGGTGASAAGSSTTAAPSVSLTTTRSGSFVYGVGNDWTRALARTIGTNQAMVHQWVDSRVGDTFWVQARNGPVNATGTVAQLNDTAPTGSRWNFAAVEIVTPTAAPTVAVPNVLGQLQAAAQSILASSGLVVGTVTSQSSASVPSGAVISQDPAAASQVSAGAAVALVVSTGPPLVTVPNVVGQLQTAAVSMLSGASLAAGTVTSQSSPTVPLGVVISQTPTAGTQAVTGSTVALLVSSGVAVPNVVGLVQATAQSAITAASLTLGTINSTSSATVPAGNVINQTPVAGTLVSFGAQVNLTVSLGPSQVAVPSVAGLSQNAAQAALTGATLSVGTITTANSGTVPTGNVISQSPVAGTLVAPGASVNLIVSLGPAQVVVPTVTGLSQNTAQAVLTGASLAVGTVATTNSPVVPAGNVIAQSPVAGTLVVPGAVVNLTVSLGPAVAVVPSVVGMTHATAQNTIVGASLLVGTVTSTSSSTTPAGNVISQSPLAGTPVQVGSPVSLVISTGASTGLIAAYGFEEVSGNTTADLSGQGQTGSISGATRTASGRYGRALSFDGVNDLVTVADSAALDLTTGLTIEAWVRPASLSGWRTILLKERTDGLSYSLYANSDTSRPAGYIRRTTDVGVAGTSPLAVNTWSHLALTYDSTTIRLFVNGVQVVTRSQTGAITTSSSPLRIGGNLVWGEYFAGLIDEVRIYNRARSQTEIQSDMNQPVAGGN